MKKTTQNKTPKQTEEAIQTHTTTNTTNKTHTPIEYTRTTTTTNNNSARTHTHTDGDAHADTHPVTRTHTHTHTHITMNEHKQHFSLQHQQSFTAITPGTSTASHNDIQAQHDTGTVKKFTCLEMRRNSSDTALILLVGDNMGYICMYQSPTLSKHTHSIHFTLAKRFKAYTQEVCNIHFHPSPVPSSREKRMFLMGFHARVGAQSSLLHSFSNAFMFDQNLIGLIFSFLGLQLVFVSAGEDDSNEYNVKIWGFLQEHSTSQYLLKSIFHQYRVFCVKLSHSGLLLTGGFGGKIRIYEPQPLFSLRCTYQSSAVNGRIISGAWSSFNKYFATLDDNFGRQVLQVWDSSGRTRLKKETVWDEMENPDETTRVILSGPLTFVGDDILLCASSLTSNTVEMLAAIHRRAFLHCYHFLKSSVTVTHIPCGRKFIASVTKLIPHLVASSSSDGLLRIHQLHGNQMRLLGSVRHQHSSKMASTVLPNGQIVLASIIPEENRTNAGTADREVSVTGVNRCRCVALVCRIDVFRLCLFK